MRSVNLEECSHCYGYGYGYRYRRLRDETADERERYCDCTMGDILRKFDQGRSRDASAPSYVNHDFGDEDRTDNTKEQQ